MPKNVIAKHAAFVEPLACSIHGEIFNKYCMFGNNIFGHLVNLGPLLEKNVFCHGAIGLTLKSKHRMIRTNLFEKLSILSSEIFLPNGVWIQCETNGAMAEYMIFQEMAKVHKVPKNITAKHAACLEPLN